MHRIFLNKLSAQSRVAKGQEADLGMHVNPTDAIIVHFVHRPGAGLVHVLRLLYSLS